MVCYVDTSAFLKLVVAEDESDAMQVWCAGHGPKWSSQFLLSEALRAGKRLAIPEDAMLEALDAVSLVLPSAATFAAAGRLEPARLRALDALHLATALEIGADLEGLVTYDSRMTEGARAASIPVVSPA